MSGFAPEQLGLRALYDFRSADATGFYDQSGNGRAQAAAGAGGAAPLWLPYTAPQVYLPGSSNRITSNNGTSFDVTDLDVWSEITISDWTPATIVTLIERQGGDPTRAFQLLLDTNGTVALKWFPTGSAASVITRTTSTSIETATGVTAGGAVAVRATLDVDDGAGNHVVTFYHRLGGFDGTWTLWQTITTAGTTSLPSVSRVIELGGSGAGAGTVPVAIRRARLHASIGGAVRADFNASLCGQSGYTDAVGSVGAAWTVARSTTGRKSVVQSPTANSARGMFLLGTDDWIDVPAAAIPPLDTYAAASGVIVVFRRWHNPGTAGHPIFTTKASVGDAVLGVAIRLSTTAASTDFAMRAGDGAASDGPNVTGNALGSRSVAAMSVGDAAPFLSGQVNGGTVASDSTRATTVSTSTGGAGRVGAFTGGTAPLDAEIEALLTRDTPFTAAEIAQVNTYYGAGL